MQNEAKKIKFKRYLPDRFVLGLFIMIFIAWIMPGMGMGKGFINLETIIDFGIALIFFFYGLRLSPAKFKAGIRNWKLHVAIQSITFIIFPLLVLPFHGFFAGTSYEMLWLAVFFLAALPSTVSSSVVMVSIAKGNIPGAIFNASLSGVVGIFATPLWMSLFLGRHSDTFAFTDILLQLVIQILLPVFLGLLLNKMFGAWAEKYKKELGTFDKSIILLIVYKSFSHSFENDIFKNVGVVPLIFLIGIVLLIFFLVFFLSKGIAKALRFSREDSIAATFCGTKKSLVHGSVMYNVLFTNPLAGGILLLPIMIFHAFQLFFISIVAKRMGAEQENQF